MELRRIDCDVEKAHIARTILEALTPWFGIPEAREDYISGSNGQPFFCAFQGETPVGFLYLRQTGRDTLELAVMGVLQEYHRSGIGHALFRAAKAEAREQGYAFLQVKTVQMGHYPTYDATNRFYLAMGFRELEVFPTLWDPWNPCQVYIMAI